MCIVQAFASFAAALAVQPAHAEATVACAAVYRSSGQLLRAVSTLETASTAAPTDITVQQAYAAALNALGEQRRLLLVIPPAHVLLKTSTVLEIFRPVLMLHQELVYVIALRWFVCKRCLYTSTPQLPEGESIELD